MKYDENQKAVSDRQSIHLKKQLTMKHWPSQSWFYPQLFHTAKTTNFSTHVIILHLIKIYSSKLAIKCSKSVNKSFIPSVIHVQYFPLLYFLIITTLKYIYTRAVQKCQCVYGNFLVLLNYSTCIWHSYLTAITVTNSSTGSHMNPLFKLITYNLTEISKWCTIFKVHRIKSEFLNTQALE